MQHCQERLVHHFSICNDGKNDLAGSKKGCRQENIKQKKPSIFSGAFFVTSYFFIKTPWLAHSGQFN
jgi:hypothetical protein